jgi:hypothetical protein
MKKFLAAVIGLGIASVAYANCSTHTVTGPSGKMVTCTTCCYNGNCHTTCF